MFNWLISFCSAMFVVVVVCFSVIGIAELSDYIKKKRISNLKLDNALCTASALTGPAIFALISISLLTWSMHDCLYKSN